MDTNGNGSGRHPVPLPACPPGRPRQCPAHARARFCPLCENPRWDRQALAPFNLSPQPAGKSCVPCSRIKHGTVMEARAEELLRRLDEDPPNLFAHGGCHIFARILHQHTGHELVSIRNASRQHNHVACVPEEGFILDAYGWWSRSAYVEEEGRDLGIDFYPLKLGDLEQQFIITGGSEFYDHPDFAVPASAKAQKWIALHCAYFDGRKRCPIPGYSRRNAASIVQLAAIYEKEPR